MWTTDVRELPDWMAMPEPIERPNGASEIHIHKQQYPLKVYLIFVFGLVLVAFAWGGRNQWATQAMSSSPTPPAAYSADQPIYVVLTVLVDHPSTFTSTPTSTMMSWELTAEAKPTHTKTPYMTATPYQSPTHKPTATPTPPPTPLMHEQNDTEAG
jgi:hypothetical protein